MITQTSYRIFGKNYYTTLIGNVEIMTDYLSYDANCTILNNIAYYSFDSFRDMSSMITDGWRLPNKDDLMIINYALRNSNNLGVDLLSKEFNPKSKDSFGLSMYPTGLIDYKGDVLCSDSYCCMWMEYDSYSAENGKLNFAALHEYSTILDMYHCDECSKLPIRLVRRIE